MVSYKHNSKELYLKFDLGFYELLWAIDRELRYKRSDKMDLTNFHEISFDEFKRWRIHEVFWDGDYKISNFEMVQIYNR